MLIVTYILFAMFCAIFYGFLLTPISIIGRQHLSPDGIPYLLGAWIAGPVCTTVLLRRAQALKEEPLLFNDGIIKYLRVMVAFFYSAPSALYIMRKGKNVFKERRFDYYVLTLFAAGITIFLILCFIPMVNKGKFGIRYVSDVKGFIFRCFLLFLYFASNNAVICSIYEKISAEIFKSSVTAIRQSDT